MSEVKRDLSQESRIGILGLAFKPNSDDVRLSPSAQVINELLNDGYLQITAYDPLAMESFDRLYGLPVAYADSLEQLVEACDCLILLTAWDEFKEQKKLLKNKKVYDFRYCL